MESLSTLDPRTIEKILHKKSNSVSGRQEPRKNKTKKTEIRRDACYDQVFRLKETASQANLLISEGELVIPAVFKNELFDQIKKSPLQTLVEPELSANKNQAGNTLRLTSFNLRQILSQVLKGKSKWEIEIDDIEAMKSIDILKILDLDQEPVSNYVENMALKMNDVFKIEKVKTLERKLSTFLKQPNADILQNEK